MSALAPTLQAFFTERLIRQRHVSEHTIAAYRDTLRLLLGYAAEQTALAPSALDLADLDASLIAGFLDHLQSERGNSARTRNARLAAIHSLFRFAALHHPEHAASISRVLAIPPKRFDRAVITYLTEPEVDALLACCDLANWTGRRDQRHRESERPLPPGGQGQRPLPDRASRHEMPVPGDQIPGPHRARQGTMDHAVEASAQRVRHHLRRPLAGSRNLLMKTAGNTVSETVPARMHAEK